MLDLLIDLMWIIINFSGILIVVYCFVRLAAIAWHKTKKEYDTFPYEEHPESEHPEREHPERE